MSIQIQPVVQTQTITGVTLQSVEIVPFTSAAITVSLWNADLCIKASVLHMPTEDYLRWNSDDQFLLDWVLNKLGFQKM